MFVVMNGSQKREKGEHSAFCKTPAAKECYYYFKQSLTVV